MSSKISYGFFHITDVARHYLRRGFPPAVPTAEGDPASFSEKTNTLATHLDAMSPLIGPRCPQPTGKFNVHFKPILHSPWLSNGGAPFCILRLGCNQLRGKELTVTPFVVVFFLLSTEKHKYERSTQYMFYPMICFVIKLTRFGGFLLFWTQAGGGRLAGHLPFRSGAGGGGLLCTGGRYGPSPHL